MSSRGLKARQGALFFILSLLLLVLAFPFLLKVYLKRELVKLGLENLSFQPSFQSATELSLGPLAFTYPTAIRRIEVRVGDLLASYSYSSLQEKKLRRLDLKDGEILSHTTATPPHSHTTTSSQQRGGFLASLPFAELTLENIRIRFDNGTSLRLSKGMLSIEKEFQLTGEVELSEKFSIPFSLQGKIQGETLESKVELPIKGLERPIVGSLRYAMDQQDGEFEFSTEAKDSKALERTFSNVVPSALSQLEVKKLQCRLKGKIAQNQLLGLVLSLKAEALHSSGISVENFSLTVEPQSKDITEVRAVMFANLLGGEVALEDSRINLKTKEMELPFRVKSVLLQDLLKVYPQDGLSGEARLQGELILRKDKLGEFRAEGELHAESPGGIIRYRRVVEGQEPSALSFATQALEDFHFTKLDAPFTLDPQGELSIQLSLGGNNPQWQGGRAVEFNINLDQNLYSLLRSIRLSRGELGALR